MLIAGSRPDGAPQFSSESERKHFDEIRDWFKLTYLDSIKSEMTSLGCFSVYLTDEEINELRLDCRILSVEKSIKYKTSYIQANAGWALEVACGRTDNKFKYSTDGTGVKIYILDTGIAAIPEFENRLSHGFDADNGAPVTNVHGTAVASAAAGKIYGVAKKAQIISVRLGSLETFDSSDILAGINWVLSDHTAEPAVVNMSFGNYTSEPLISSAVASMIAEGIICVAAAGNDASTNTFYPAGYTDVVCVGAIQEDLDLAPFSNRGAQVDILAPGRFVVTTNLVGSPEEFSGTSMASPYVAGAAACLITGLIGMDQSDFRTILLEQAQLNLSTHVVAATTKNVVFTDMTRVWFGNTGSVGNLKPFKKYRLKPYTQVGTVKTYLTEHTVLPLKRLSALKRVGGEITNKFGLVLNYNKVVPGENPEMALPTGYAPGGGGGDGGDGGGEPGAGRYIISTLDPKTMQDLSLNLTPSSGTVSFTVYQKPPYEVKEMIEIQGMSCRVERIGPTYTRSAKAFAVECRVTPPFTREFVSVKYMDMEDGDSHSVHDIIKAVAAQAGTNVTVTTEDVNIQEFTGTGRFVSILESLAEEICGTLIQQNGAWFIVNKDYVIGDFIVPSADLDSISQSSQGDILDTLSSLVEDLKQAGIEASRIARETAKLQKELDKLDDEDIEEEVEDEDLFIIKYAEPMEKISFSFGNTANGNGKQPIDNAIKVETIWGWEVWETAEAGASNPQNPGKWYYQVVEDRDDADVYTGKMRGLTEIHFADLLYEFTPPSNSSDLYYGRGRGTNIFGTTEVDTGTWQQLHVVKRSRLNQVTNRIETKHYFRFSPQVSGVIWPGVTSETDEHMYALDLDVAYIPTISIQYKFHGTVSYLMWPVLQGDIPVGMVSPDGSFYNINGSLITEVESVTELPGTIANRMCILADGGGLAATFDSFEFKSITNEHCGVQSAVNPHRILLGNNMTGRLVGYTTGGVIVYTAWPGFDIDNPEPYAQAQEDLVIRFKEELPTSEGIDFSTFDPQNPGDWIPPNVDPNDQEVVDKQRRELELQIKELEIDGEVNAAKIRCIEKELTSYGVDNLIPFIRAAADAYIAIEIEEERQSDWGTTNKTTLRNLYTEAIAKDMIVMDELVKCNAYLLKTDCSFLYNNTLPLPMNRLNVPFLLDNSDEFYESDAGIIDSVSLRMSHGSCLVTVTAVRRKE